MTVEKTKSIPKNHGISSSWWLGDPRPLPKTHPNPSVAGLPVILTNLHIYLGRGQESEVLYQ